MVEGLTDLCGACVGLVQLLYRHADLLAHPDQHPMVKIGIEDYPSVSHTAPDRGIESIRFVEWTRREGGVGMGARRVEGVTNLNE